MSPEEICPRCGNRRLFHKDEVKGVRKGEIVCVDCVMEEQFNTFLVEVLDGKHKAMIRRMYEEMVEGEE